MERLHYEIASFYERRPLESAEEMLARHPGFLSEATLDLGYWARERRHEFMRLRLRLPTDIPLFPGVKNVRFVIDPSVTGRPRLDGRHNFMFKPVGSLIWRVTPNLTLDLDIGKKGGAKPVFGLGLTIRY